MNKKYNYVYKTINLINMKYYIGVHRTDILEDGYLGSGKAIKNAIQKYGKENFKREILHMCESEEEAFELESKIVNHLVVEDGQSYNLRFGGDKGCIWTEEYKAHMSNVMKEKQKDLKYKNIMEKVYSSEERSKKISEGVKNWINTNPEKHNKKMVKINKNPIKINKTANTHKGTIRTEIARKNISEGIQNYIKNDPNSSLKHGKGSIYIHNEELGIRKRILKTDVIPDGWKRGLGPQNGGRTK